MHGRAALGKSVTSVVLHDGHSTDLQPRVVIRPEAEAHLDTRLGSIHIIDGEDLQITFEHEHRIVG